ncbi:MAG: hypothetical protein IPO93_17350 [Actinobacteria bacterium]|jgi:ABC-type oligopeptide transport system ATPase subunit|nr:hypothetical protein [Actinomycetota bacterium]
MTVAVEADGRVRTFAVKKGATVESVRGVDLRVESGDVFGFVGTHGADTSRNYD